MSEPQEPDAENAEVVEPEFTDERVEEMQDLSTRAALMDETESPQ